MMTSGLVVQKVEAVHFKKIQELCQRVYPFVKPWTEAQLNSHLSVFPEGQLIIIDPKTKNAIGYAASLVLNWTDYEMQDSWTDLTDSGFFTNHDLTAEGKTLYGAEVMVDPAFQGQGVGTLLYQARAELVEKLGLLRIRAGARMRGYSKYEHQFPSARDYLIQVVSGNIFDPTLSFQIKRGFKVLALVSGYLGVDPESKGYAAVIEWLNPKVATQRHYDLQNKAHKKLIFKSTP